MRSSNGGRTRIMLSVVEIFPTLQGEGSRAGQPAVFVRFAGCNLWSGHEDTRHNGKGACAKWCDTVFVGGEKHTPQSLEQKILSVAHEHGIDRSPMWLLVLTGGEPLLQLRKQDGVTFLERMGEICTIAVETNGTVPVGAIEGLIDHVTVSPKPLAESQESTDHIVLRSGTDLKVVVGGGWSLGAIRSMHSWSFRNRFVQPIDDEEHHDVRLKQTIDAACDLGWKVSIQLHKLLGMP